MSKKTDHAITLNPEEWRIEITRPEEGVGTHVVRLSIEEFIDAFVEPRLAKLEVRKDETE